MAEANATEEKPMKRINDGVPVINTNFTSLVTGLCGAQGLKYDNTGKLFMVTPFRTVEGGGVAGQVISVDVADAKVGYLFTVFLQLQ